jgi:hypothetical protein
MRHDLANAVEFEERVATQMGVPVHTRFKAKDDLDIWVPGYYVEIKEKRQPLTARWHLLPDTDEPDLFVIDEQTVRRALRHWPNVYFLLRDVPGGGRLFLVPIWEIVVNEKVVRRNRVEKGKWILDLTDYRQLGDIADLHSIAVAELGTFPWKQAQCLTSPMLPAVEQI